ncbi:MAG: RluA family pseudouridine synthase [Clostridia bacterium]|nr:RluA family pseudouridine synthase [Clostridia bacterium]
MDRTITLTIEKDCLLRDFLRSRYSGQRIRFLREKGHILLNGAPVTVRATAKAGDALTLVFKETGAFDYAPEDLGVRTVYEDEDVLLVYKPAGIASMPAAPHFTGNLFNGVKFLYPEGVFRVVTRLDKDTSGLVLLAKNALSHSILCEEIRSVEKTYLAVCTGEVPAPLVISAPISSDGGAKRFVSENGKPAKTRIISSKPVKLGSLVKIVTETGRTHQIRVHLAHIGHPLVGDRLYGNDDSVRFGQLLTCCGISFVHPVSRQKAVFTIDGEADLLEREQFSQ